MEEIDNSNEKIKINPYNFNNKLLTIKKLQSILSNYDVNYEITDLSTYQQAFVHKSYCKKDPEENQNDDVELAEKPEGCLELQEKDNEQLEFLGDSIISSVIANYLYDRYYGQDEGFMTRLRTKIVNGESLGKLAGELDFGKYLLISRHVEDRCNGRSSTRILEDVFEAFIGAIFLDFNKSKLNTGILSNTYSGIGFQIAEMFIINVIEAKIDFSELILKDYNYKDQLLRYFQQLYQETPKYKEVCSEGPPHDRTFTMCVEAPNGDIIAEGIGRSKKKAEQLASKNALIKYKVIENISDDI